MKLCLVTEQRENGVRTEGESQLRAVGRMQVVHGSAVTRTVSALLAEAKALQLTIDWSGVAATG